MKTHYLQGSADLKGWKLWVPYVCMIQPHVSFAYFYIVASVAVAGSLEVSIFVKYLWPTVIFAHGPVYALLSDETPQPQPFYTWVCVSLFFHLGFDKIIRSFGDKFVFSEYLRQLLVDLFSQVLLLDSESLLEGFEGLEPRSLRSGSKSENIRTAWSLGAQRSKQ